mmetsp:Transcript_39708/g.95916  ORF Transcript_39708/g.95916 Transcript_39708/m.95916 type:complete len:202 (+) Transcript_39708:302-907(+)
MLIKWTCRSFENTKKDSQEVSFTKTRKERLNCNKWFLNGDKLESPKEDPKAGSPKRSAKSRDATCKLAREDPKAAAAKEAALLRMAAGVVNLLPGMVIQHHLNPLLPPLGLRLLAGLLPLLPHLHLLLPHRCLLRFPFRFLLAQSLVTGLDNQRIILGRLRTMMAQLDLRKETGMPMMPFVLPLRILTTFSLVVPPLPLTI